MPEGQGFRARAHDLVGVAAASMHAGEACRSFGLPAKPAAVAPGAKVDTAGLLPRASRRSLAVVDAPAAVPPVHGVGRLRARRQSAARPVNPRLSGYAWVQNFNNGNQNNNDKGWSRRVRAVRK